MLETGLIAIPKSCFANLFTIIFCWQDLSLYEELPINFVHITGRRVYWRSTTDWRSGGLEKNGKRTAHPCKHVSGHKAFQTHFTKRWNIVITWPLVLIDSNNVIAIWNEETQETKLLNASHIQVTNKSAQVNSNKNTQKIL